MFDTRDRPLSPKQLLFVQEYIIDFCGSHAAKRAGYSDKTSARIACQCLENPKIQAAITRELKAREKRTHIRQDRVLQELAAIAFFDPRKLFRPNGAPIPINELDDATAAAIASLEILEEFEGTGENRTFVGYTKKYRMNDKNTALANAMKHLGMLRDQMVHLGPNGGPVEHDHIHTASQEMLKNIKDRICARRRK